MISILRLFFRCAFYQLANFCNECWSVNFAAVASTLLCLRGKLDSLLHDVTACAANNLSYVCLDDSAPNSSTHVDEDTKFVLDLVRGGVPVGIIQLFLPSHSKGAAGPCLRETSDDDITGMCKFVKAFAKDYASNTTNDWNSCSKDDYVCNAIYRAATSNNTQNFSCLLWQQKSIRNRMIEKMSLHDKVELTDKLKTSRNQALFLGTFSSKDCSKKCSDEWRPVCSVSALLLDILPKVPPNCPKTTNVPCNCSETSNTEIQTCQVFKNGTVSSLSAGSIDIKLPEKLVTKEVTVSVSQLLDGGKGKTVSMMISIMEKMVNVSTSTANVSMSGSVVVVKLPDNKMSVKLAKKGVPVSVNVALDGGNVSMTASRMNGSVSIMEKTVTMLTSKSDVSTSGNEMFIFKDKTKTVLSVNRQWVRMYTKGTDTTIYQNRNEVTIQKKGTFVSASINSSTIKVFTNKTNVTMSTKGLNLKVHTDTLPMAFSINEADLTINEDSTDVNWTCNISQQGKEFTCCVHIV